MWIKSLTASKQRSPTRTPWSRANSPPSDLADVEMEFECTSEEANGLSDFMHDNLHADLGTVWTKLRHIARLGAAHEGWCPLCNVTIGNGCVAHSVDCVLYDAKDDVG
jgi:hypothetical protein